jgi:diaminopimelate decarboxylase
MQSGGTIAKSMARSRSTIPNEVIVCAGMKGNFGLATRKVIVEEGGGGDAFGIGELTVAMMAGSDPRKIVINGTNKQPDTLAAAIDTGVLIQADCLDELDDIERIATEMGATARLSLRVRLPLSTLANFIYKDPRYPDGISPTLWESTFKFGMEPEALYRAVERALRMKNVSFEGLMYHGGIPRRAGFYREETAELLDIAHEIKRQFGWEPKYLNIGGGFVPTRVGADIPPTMDDYAAGISGVITAKCKEHGLRVPILMMEPGRYCWDSAGLWLTRVGMLKEDTTLAKRKWAYVDGNTNEMGDPFDPRSRVHHVVLANDAKRRGSQTVDVCGGTCNAADILAKQRELPPMKRGDLLAFLDMGAYNESFAHQSNAIPRSATVMVSNGRAAVVRRRETVQDVLARDTIPSWLLRRHAAQPA